ncbi:MAG: hypothetical protein QOK21_988 [Solirubrobacteraceae bacterium]|nr:hypothetical protein [Solirubrobacteraceae bacterium]
MSSEPQPLGRNGGRPCQARHASGDAECVAGPGRHGFQVPIVKELPRRWDPLIEGEVVSEGTD